uniref:Uncharacterized protein n=1 Tax=Oryza nivara TaxID=4536 RepID=A0A0E0J8U5_ORYNI
MRKKRLLFDHDVNVLVLKRHQNRHLFDFHISVIFMMPIWNPSYPVPMPGSQLAPIAFSVVVFEFKVLSGDKANRWANYEIMAANVHYEIEIGPC